MNLFAGCFQCWVRYQEPMSFQITLCLNVNEAMTPGHLHRQVVVILLLSWIPSIGQIQIHWGTLLLGVKERELSEATPEHYSLY